ncbi:cysteine desulfurase [Candidatus Beckwithbacteria bacterium RBG_13_42_9]|uniref:Cysteine desulfurase n=1 Tax=Candidatus Beckwithbacteria bacterium RBG_13_42_9 TaxID=1797457 RepID=A0A1F5E3M5_9BACT|nr:MAG: cysteine desulfurase [Candidatus Beckwithbacteria bacterium RBG_13_42_9]
MNLDQIRADFPILKRRIHDKPLAYFDNAATSQKPNVVIEAIKNYYENHNANVHRGVHTLAEESTTAYEQARETVAHFIGAEPKELIFVRNTTEAINLVAFSWARKNIKAGDVILTTEMEHHSNIVPWQQLAKSVGCRVEYVKVDKDYLLDWEDFKRKLKLKPKLVCVTHVSNALGTINPVKEMTSLAHKVGAKVLVDGAQAVPHLPVNVKNLNCDFYAFSGHKMLGPMGIGGLYVEAKILAEMDPFLTGGGTISEVYKDRTVFAEVPDRYDAGTPNVADAVGLAAAVDYLSLVGMENIRQHEKELTAYALEKLQAQSASRRNKLQVRVFGPKDLEKRAGVISFAIDGIHAHDAAQVLDQEGIAVRSGHHCCMILHREVLNVPATVRASFYLYNTKEEVDRLIEALGKVKEVFK